MRRLTGTLCGLSLLATFPAEGILIERSVELDLLQLHLPSYSFEATLDFDDVVLDPGTRLVLDIDFVNGDLGVLTDSGTTPTFYLALQGSTSLFNFLCCRTPTLLGTSGLPSDTLKHHEPGGLYKLDFGAPPFTYSGLRLEAEFLNVSGTVSSLFFRQSFFDPHRVGTDSIIYRVPESIPEPGTLSLLGAGFLGLILARRRRSLRP